MPDALTASQLQNFRNYIDGTAEGLSAFYRMMDSKGYGYAKLANGVVNCTWPSGSAAQNYMSRSAEEQGVQLDKKQIETIETQFAKGYADTLISMAIANGGYVSEDVTFKQSLDFHTTVLVNNGLGPQTWTLYTPYQVLGLQTMQTHWVESIDPNGSTGTFALTHGQSVAKGATRFVQVLNIQ